METDILLPEVMDIDVPASEENTLTTVEVIDYNSRFDELNSLNITIIFCIGILSGLLFGKMLWEKVHLWLMI